MENYDFRKAGEGDTGRIWEIIREAKERMRKEGRKQWNGAYPAEENIRSDVEKGYGYVLCDGKNILAYGAVVFDGEPAYLHLKGEWLSEQPYVVVHRLAVAQEAAGRGIATAFIRRVEELSASKGIRSFKVDTNFDNHNMLRIMEKCGFSPCGEISYDEGKRIAYEKLLG